MSGENCICSLPDELLLKVVQYIPPLQSDPNKNPRLSWGVQRLPLSDYRSISLVCRRLNRVVTGVMYAHYDHESDYVSSALFIRTLVQNPMLAQNLKSLKEIGPAVSDTGIPKVEPYKRSAPSVEYLCAAVQQFYQPGPHNLVQNMQNSLTSGSSKSVLEFFQSGEDTVHGLETALILALAPNIRTVAFSHGSRSAQDHDISHDQNSWVRRAKPFGLRIMIRGNRGFPSSNTHHFKYLRKLKVNMSGMEFYGISGTLRLPSLVDLILCKHDRQLRRATVDLPDDLDLDWICPAKESRVRTIRLDDMDIHHLYLVKLIQSCQHLEAFAFRSVSDWDKPPLDYSLFFRELQEHHPELQSLNTTNFRHLHDLYNPNDVPTRIGSLSGFRNLTYLAAPLELLVSPSYSDQSLYLGNLLPRSLKTCVLSKGEALCGISSPPLDGRFDRVLCDKHIQSIVDACQNGRFQLQAFGIHYTTDFRYAGVPGGYANTSKDLARMEDVHFDFFKFTRDFTNCHVHFDYVIKVNHDGSYEAHERLISVRRINGDAVADEYSYRLNSTFDSVPNYELRGFGHPRFLNTEGEEWKVHRKKIPYEFRKEV